MSVVMILARNRSGDDSWVSVYCWPVPYRRSGGRRTWSGTGGYCPGEFSVNDGHGHKLIGTAQRLVRGGWLFGTVILVTDPEPVRQVLTKVYDALGLDWEPSSVGAVETTVPGVTVDDIKSAVLEAYAGLGPVVIADLTNDVLELAASRIDRHRLPM